MNSETGRDHDNPRKLSNDDSYYYGDLLWERDLQEERRHSKSSKTKHVNVTARIEDYLRSFS